MSLFEIPVVAIDGAETTLAPWRGEVLLVVNVASQCGFTPQYAGLESLYRAHHAAGFSVLGFPCDQFGNQEPGTEAEIAAFCERNYGVTFPLFAKVDVNGSHTHPLFDALKSARPGVLGTEDIKWNFTKFLIGRDGSVRKRYSPTDSPESIEPDIVAALAESPSP